MLFLLPPSETKRTGGTGRSLSPGEQRFPELDAIRDALRADLTALAADGEAMMAALKLGPRLSGEVEVNRALAEAPTLPALERYTGVLFDELQPGAWSPASWAYAADHVLVHSALFGLVGGADPLPNYRLSSSARLGGASLKKRWAEACTRALAGEERPIIDLRSESYVALGPRPSSVPTVFVRVVTPGDGGIMRALNHFNKKGKGQFIERVIRERCPAQTPAELCAWANGHGFRLEMATDGSGELLLVV